MSFVKKKKLFYDDYCDLGKISKKNKIPTLYISKVNNKKAINWIKNKKPEIIFCFGWPEILKEKILNIPSEGALGWHPTNLPYNKGRHPLIWTLILDLKSSASTFFIMNNLIDSGNIISKKKFKVSSKDSSTSLYKKIIKIAIQQLQTIFHSLKNTKYKSFKQKKTLGNYWRKRSSQDGMIDWRMSSRNIYNLIRSLKSPYSGATFFYKNKTIKIFDSTITKIKKNCINHEPGKILKVKNNKFLVKCGDQAITIYNLKPKIVLKKGEYL